MSNFSQEEHDIIKAEDLEFEAVMGALRAEGALRRKLRRRKHQLLFIHLSVGLVTVVVGCGLLQRSIERSIDNAFAPITLALNGPVGQPEQGLVMSVHSITGYTDSNGNYVRGRLDEIESNFDEIEKIGEKKVSKGGAK
ncbi:TPA: hypothetical protein ACOENU_000262 [Stenotrophomonas maltophilia]